MEAKQKNEFKGQNNNWNDNDSSKNLYTIPLKPLELEKTKKKSS